MKITTQFIDILKTYSKVNDALLIEPGNKLRAWSDTIYAETTLPDDQEFSVTFGVFNLSRFNSVISIFNDPQLSFSKATDNLGNPQSIIMKDDFSEIVYDGCSLDVTDIKMPSAANAAKIFEVMDDNCVEFTMSESQLERLNQGVAALGMEHIIFEGDGEKISVKSASIRAVSNTGCVVEIDQETDREFKCVLAVKNVIIPTGDYRVKISKFGALFENDTSKFLITMDAEKSKFI